MKTEILPLIAGKFKQFFGIAKEAQKIQEKRKTKLKKQLVRRSFSLTQF